MFRQAMQKRREKHTEMVLALILVLNFDRSCQLYKDVKEHDNKIITLAGDEARIQNAATTFKFFISFWVKFPNRAYFRKKLTLDRFTLKMVTAINECIWMDPGSWMFFVLPHTIEKTSPSSFKLHPLDLQRLAVVGVQSCLLSTDPVCDCSGLNLQDLDSEFGSIVVVPSGGYQLSLDSYDGTGGKAELRTLTSGLSTVTANDMVTHRVLAELMKGQSSNLFEVNYLNLDYNVIVAYLGRFTQEEAYSNFGDGGLSILLGYHVDLGRHNEYAESTDSNKLVKNFC